jgi:peptidoglycan/LPS O-acetylase OafA/YrhL
MANGFVPPRPPQRYHTLDGMRGFAALVVTLYHFGQHSGDFAHEGYLAVDLFFVLSGFVIALNYTSRLAHGLSWLDFLKARLVRLYPLYLAGLALGALKHLVGHLLRDSHVMGYASLSASVFFGSLMLPLPFAPESLYPLNGPAWSLSLELVVNILFAVALFKLPSRYLVVIMAVAAAFLIPNVVAPTFMNMGWAWAHLAGGLARTLFAFPAGILIYRHLPRGSRPESWLALLPIALMMGVMFLKLDGPTQAFWELTIALLLLPGLVIGGTLWEPPAPLRPTFTFLGDISYAVYALHWPLIAVIMPFLERANLPPAVGAAIYLIFVIAVSTIVYTFFDKPVRKWLGTWRRQRPPARAF